MIVVLSDVDVQRFRADGFLLLDGLVSQDELRALECETESALQVAFGVGSIRSQLDGYLNSRGGPRSGAVLGQYLPMMSPTTPISIALAQSSEIVSAAGRAIGSDRLICKPAKAVRYVDSSFWHRDATDDLGAAKLIFYLKPASGVFFDIVKGSHLTVTASGQEVERPNEYSVVQIRQGQGLLFDVRILHRSSMTVDRLQWSVTYMKEPSGPKEADQAAAAIGSFFGKHPSYDEVQFPFFPESWTSSEPVAPLARSLARSGVLARLLERHAAHFQSRLN